MGCDEHEEEIKRGVWVELGRGTRSGRNLILKPNHYIVAGALLVFKDNNLQHLRYNIIMF